MRGLAAFAVLFWAVLVCAATVALLPSSAWAVECGTSENPCVTYVRLDEAQDAALDDLKVAAAVGGGALVICQLVIMIGGWGRRG